MKKVNYKKENNLLETLLALPKKNLESRIKEFENEINKRQSLSNDALSRLGTHQLQIKDKLWQLRYSSMANEGFIVNRDFIRQFNNLEEQKIKEMIGCLNDVMQLNEKLQQAREEFELEIQKIKLLESDMN